MAGLGGIIGTIMGWLGYQVGLRTDAADGSGSVHAKIVDLKNKIGTSADTRASNTVMGALSTGIKSWQNVVFSPSSTSGNIAIANVNPAKCIVLFQGGGSRCIEGINYAYAIMPWLTGLTATNVSFGMPNGQYGYHSVTVIEFY